MEEPFLSPILGIVRVKFLSGRQTEGRADGPRTGTDDVVPSFRPSLRLLRSVARRTSLQELVNIPWSGEWNVRRSSATTLRWACQASDSAFLRPW